jgi:phosphoribosylaminoimidazolecarboxamide formyltransferase/IMP cyclohydrolase
MTPSTTPPKTYDDVREQIDIGGPAMVRSAAKNFRRVAILVNWSDAGRINTSGAEATTTLEDRFELMKNAFGHTAEYDGTIVNFWSALISPKRVRDFYLEGK